jgi:hypothetical protein
MDMGVWRPRMQAVAACIDGMSWIGRFLQNIMAGGTHLLSVGSLTGMLRGYDCMYATVPPARASATTVARPPVAAAPPPASAGSPRRPLAMLIMNLCISMY